MEQCAYSIIPKIKDSNVCSSCGKDIEGLTYYTQIMQLYLLFKIDGSDFHYVRLGLGVPMCDECDNSVSGRLEKIYSSIAIIIIFFLALAVFWLIGWISGSDIRYISFPVIGGLIILMIYRDKSKYDTGNRYIEDKGKEKIDPVYDYLDKNGWRQNMSKARIIEGYSPASLKADLDGICAGGRFCLIDNRTRQMVDYHDPDTLEKVFNESIWVEDRD